MLGTQTAAQRPRSEVQKNLHAGGEYLTTAEAAELLRLKPKTLRNKVLAGVFREGHHFYRKAGLGPRWKREALVLWLESTELPDVDEFSLAQPGGRAIA